LLAAMGERDRFSPVVDGQTLPDQVGLLFAAGKQHKVPYLTGGNSWEASLGRKIGGGFSPAFAARLVPDIDKARLYPGLRDDAVDDAVFGDLIILAHSRYLANRMREQGVPVYSYYFSYVAADRRERQPGAAHADDIAFVMGTLDDEADLSRVTARDRAVSQLMTDYWVQFAKTGDPNGPGLPEWPVWEPGPARVLEIGDEVVARDGLLAERMDYHLRRGQARMNEAR
jgi:para-nitrobenzyl esterase